MIAPIECLPLERLRGISRDLHHPFQHTAHESFEAMRVASSRFDVGALVTNGETGVASAAMDIGARLYIPLTGFAPRGKFNETGYLKAHHAPLLREPGGEFSTLTAEEARTESKRHAPFARRLAIREAEDLNACHSCAVVIMSHQDLVLQGSIDVARLKLLGDRFDTFVCDLQGEPALEAAQLRNFLSLRKPWFLNIIGPRESLGETCSYSVYDRCSDILSRAFGDHS